MQTKGIPLDAWAVSLAVHALVGLLFLMPWPEAPAEAEALPVELVDIPWTSEPGDAGNAGTRPSPKEVMRPRRPTAADAPEAPAERIEAPQRQLAASPVRKAAPVKSADLGDLLAERQRQRAEAEARRLGQLASAAEPDVMPGDGRDAGDPVGGAIDAGAGVSGDLAQRRILSRVIPEYPASARRQGLEGSVRLRLWVNASGQVSRVEILKFSGTSEMDERALAAVKRWVFAPLADEAVPMSQWGDLTLRYRLE